MTALGLQKTILFFFGTDSSSHLVYVYKLFDHELFEYK